MTGMPTVWILRATVGTTAINPVWLATALELFSAMRTALFGVLLAPSVRIKRQNNGQEIEESSEG